VKRALALLILALLALPAARAVPSEPEYPEEILALLPGWIDEAAALVQEDDRERPWWPEAESFLQKARAASDAGRFRVGLFHIETFDELLVARRLMDDAATLPSEAEGRTYVLRSTRGWNQDAMQAWADYRAELHAYDGELRSLVTLEKVLYASDMATSAAISARTHESYARDFPSQPGIPDGYVFALVRASHAALLTIERSQQILAEVVKGEGLPPRIVDEGWADLMEVSLEADRGTPAAHLESLDALARPVRENGESTLAVAMELAYQRANRASSMQTIFGDAASRGQPVVEDAARGMGRQLNNTTIETPRSYGLSGVFTSDAIDRALFTQEFVSSGNATLATVIAAWASLEHQQYVTTALSFASPVKPEPPVDDTPAAPLALMALALVAAALARRR
jgi:hypothetical protein